MMEVERASEKLDCSSILTRLVARENFIAFSTSFALCVLINSFKVQIIITKIILIIIIIIIIIITIICTVIMF
jgi:hypothetical protein